MWDALHEQTQPRANSGTSKKNCVLEKKGIMCFGLGSWMHVLTGMHACGYAYNQTFKPCVHAITQQFCITYAVKYTYADPVKCNCGKVGPWVTLVGLQVTQVTQTQSMDYKNECKFTTRSARERVRLNFIYTEALWYEWYILCSQGWLLPLEGLLLTFGLADMDKNDNPHF